jgi:hypothetical protein
MAPTTTNFGWDIPQSTDLVKDGATAIAALGQDIDTALVDLKGGTTGQVLAKASGTDLDFTWSADAGIPVTILDAKGDLIAASAADTAARLAVGTNGQILTADSSTATGLKWASAGASGKVLQVVSATYTTQTNIASTTFTDTGLSLSITPSATTSKILVLIQQSMYSDRLTNQTGGGLQLLRGGTTLISTDPEMFYFQAAGATSTISGTTLPQTYLDSPSTTSATTYKMQMKAASTSNSGKVIAQVNSNPSTITLLEIGI